MKNLRNIFVLLVSSFLFFCCVQKQKEIDLSNNSYLLVFSSNDALKIDLYDTTYKIFNKDYFKGADSWKLETSNQAYYLKLKNNFIIKLDPDFINNKKGEIIGYNNRPVFFSLNKPKWSKESIYGTWIKKSDLKYHNNALEDNLVLPPPPPHYFDQENINLEIVYPPNIEIKRDSLYYFEWNLVRKSKIDINLTNDVVLLDLDMPLQHYKMKQISVVSVSKDTLFVEINYRDYIDSKTVVDTLVRVSL